METRLRYGFTLYERKCNYCKNNTFWVPRSSPQKYCCQDCLVYGEGLTRRGVFLIDKKGRKIRRVLEADYE